MNLINVDLYCTPMVGVGIQNPRASGEGWCLIEDRKVNFRACMANVMHQINILHILQHCVIYRVYIYKCKWLPYITNICQALM